VPFYITELGPHCPLDSMLLDGSLARRLHSSPAWTRRLTLSGLYQIQMGRDLKDVAVRSQSFRAPPFPLYPESSPLCGLSLRSPVNPTLSSFPGAFVPGLDFWFLIRRFFELPSISLSIVLLAECSTDNILAQIAFSFDRFGRFSLKAGAQLPGTMLELI